MQDLTVEAMGTLPHSDDALDLDLGIEELDETVAPGFWDWVAGIGAGTALGAGALYLGVIAAT